ncbi:uncharacterized protein LOC119672322 [Teleopsis dalmanni]|uniref:uncharacterized protein LOC119672322 n=1 Tax=Teleopsis dalmanni TaxID=139649 RepID=UPI0018CED132|nr:uncharacterized protein LOC119672322 [Teleopsis dalmanni]
MPPKKDLNTSISAGAQKDTRTSNNNAFANEFHHRTTTTAAASAAAAAINAADLVADSRHQIYLANAKLCRLVQRCPWMYDRSHSDYARKHILEKSWAKIAKECNDTVASCKERWRNIRAAFARSVNIYKTYSGPNRVKPYYLYEELRFLLKPMTEGGIKGRVMLHIENEEADDIAPNDVEVELTEDPEDCVTLLYEDNDSSNPMAQVKIDSDMEYDLLENISTEHMGIDLQGITNTAQQNNNQVAAKSNERVLPARKRKRSIEEQLQHSGSELKMSKSDDSWSLPVADIDVKFLDTLLPDMKIMNARQKIIFKRKIYQSLEEVFDANSDFPNINYATRPNSNFQETLNNIRKLSETDLQQVNAFIKNTFQTNFDNRDNVRRVGNATSLTSSGTSFVQIGNSMRNIHLGSVIPTTIKEEAHDNI